MKILHNDKDNVNQETMKDDLKEEVTNLEIVNDISPSISPIFYRCGETNDGKMFIAMEHIEENLDNTLKANCSRTMEYRLHMYADLLCKLKQLHAKNIAHCDLKPQNIGHDSESGFKLLDLGIMAKNEKCGSGTPYYMAPEVAKYDTSSKDIASDIYSLGLIFFDIEDNCNGRILEKNYMINENLSSNLISTLDKIKNGSVERNKNYWEGSLFYDFRVTFLNVMFRVLYSMVGMEANERPDAVQLFITFSMLEKTYGDVANMKSLSQKNKDYFNKLTEILNKLDTEKMNKLNKDELLELHNILKDELEQKNKKDMYII